MPIGIRPLIDMAFKKTFGTEENKICLISLLNAILTTMKSPIIDVEIKNPYNLQDFETDKLSILDIKATDQFGAIYDIEIQLTIYSGLVQRIVFYGCELYAGQLEQGDDYRTLKPVFSICLVDGVVWKDSKEVHHRFQLHDKQTGRTLEETLEVHMLELRLFKLTEAELSGVSNKDRWLFWLLHAHEYDRERLLELFPEIAFQQATKTISAISEKEEDKIMYDAREKFVRDTQTAINAARDEGEARGEARGRLHGRITVLQQLAGLPEFSVEEFARYDEAGLKQLEAELQQQLRGRVL